MTNRPSTSAHVRRGREGGEGARIRDHLASVRTFLAWLRVGLVLLAMGYAVAKFQVIESLPNRYLGVFAAVAGWLVIVGAGVSFIRVRRSIEVAEFAPSVAWNVGLALLTAGAGVAILVYVARS